MKVCRRLEDHFSDPRHETHPHDTRRYDGREPSLEAGVLEAGALHLILENLDDHSEISVVVTKTLEFIDRSANLTRGDRFVAHQLRYVER